MTVAEQLLQAKNDYDAVYSAGYDKGYSDGESNGTGGYEDGKADAYAEVEPINTELEQTLYGANSGSTSTDGYNYFDWDAFQNNGERLTYMGAFADSSFEYIRPKYKICPRKTDTLAMPTVFCMFYCCLRLKKIEAKYFDFSGLPYDDSEPGGYFGTFAFCESLTEIEDIGLSPSKYDLAFTSCENLKTIAKITVDERVTFDVAFMECFALENIRFEGTIGQDGLDLRYSTKLSYDSIKSIINALSTTTSGLSVTLSKAAKTLAFTDDEWATLIATKSNWTIKLV